MMPTPLFIGGAGRSGTTLLGALLAEALGGTAPPESHFIHELPIRRLSAGEAAAAIARHWRFRIWELSPDCPPTAIHSGTDYVRWLAAHYGERHGIEDPRWWVDHTPENALHWPALLAAFPDARAIHLVRDARAVAASVRPLAWGPATLLGCARYWSGRVARGLESESAFFGRILRVRYEDVLSDPPAALARICEFLGERYERGAAGAGRFATPSYTRCQHGLVGRPPDPSRANAWERTMPARDVERLEAECGSLLQRLGYRLRFEAPRRARPLARFGSRGVEAAQQGVVLPLRRLPRRGPYVRDALVQRLRQLR